MSSWNDPLAGHPRYASVRTISNGPRGCVVLALDRASGEHVAVKLEQRGARACAQGITAVWNGWGGSSVGILQQF
jgi:hypothetical protein